MRVRNYTEADLTTVLRIHAESGFDYVLPPMDEFFCKRVVDDDEHGIGMVALLRHTAEAYLLCKDDWRSPAWKLEAIQKITHYCNDDAREAGVREAVAFIPPEVSGVFGRRLQRLGWVPNRQDWKTYSKVVI